MKIHLIKSNDVDEGLFSKVLELLESVSGSIIIKPDVNFSADINEFALNHQTHFDQNSFEKANPDILFQLEEGWPGVHKKEFPHQRKEATWEQLFEMVTSYRIKNKIPENEIAILLTNTANENNWFSSLDPKNPNVGFVHCADWNYYIDCPPEFPIAYEVVALSLRQNIYQNPEELFDLAHQHPRGCMNDFCENKRDIILKLRTGDICTDCMKALQKHGIPMTEINHGLDLFARFRERMLFAQNAQRNKTVSPLYINRKHQIFLTEYENIEIKFTPLEKTLYFLFLRYPEGILMSNLYLHRKELIDIYTEIYSRGSLAEMEQSIHDLSNATKNSASEKISSIKRKFIEKIGKDLADPYIIKGPNAEAKKIDLNRNNVKSEQNSLFNS